MNIHWKDWCWSWSSNTLATDVKSQLIGKAPEAWKDWRQEEKGMVPPIQWTQWVWANSWRYWRRRKPGMLQSMGSQRVRHSLATKQQIHIYHNFSIGFTTYMLKRRRQGHYTLLCHLISIYQFTHSIDWALTTFCILC